VLLLFVRAALGQSNVADGRALNNRAAALRLAARPAEAIPLFNQAVHLAESSADDRLLATALGGLGSALVDTGEIARAEPVLRRSLFLFEKSTGPDSLETGEAANNLAMLYRRSGDLEQARLQQQRALTLMQSYLPPHDPALEVAFNNIFIVLAELKQWDAAEPYLNRALEIGATLPDNQTLADVDENAALLAAHRGQYRDAAAKMQRSVSIEEHTLPPGDPRLAQSLHTYAGYLKKSNQRAEAKQVEDRARQLRRPGL
jgi:tetratricopeptide (TPR) repeat protein